MNVMVVEATEGEFHFIRQALESAGARVFPSPTLDEDHVIVHKIDAVVHMWSGFTADIETVQVNNMKEVDPKLVMVLFGEPAAVPDLRRRFPRDLVADKRAMSEEYAAPTVQALIRQVRAKREA